MSQVLLARNTLNYRRRYKRTVKFEFKSFLVVLCMGIFISFLSVNLLVHFNKASTKGYTIKYLEVQQKELWDENEILKKELLEKTSLGAMRMTAKAESMGAPQNVSYVSGRTALAQK